MYCTPIIQEQESEATEGTVSVVDWTHVAWVLKKIFTCFCLVKQLFLGGGCLFVFWLFCDYDQSHHHSASDTCALLT